MTVAEILAQATVHKKMSIDDVYGRTHLNECKHILAMLYDSACNRTSTTVACTDEDSYYDLPASCLRVHKVLDSNGDEYDKRYYRIDCGQIKFDTEDTYTVWYFYETANVTTTLEITEMFHRSMAKFVAARELLGIKNEMASKYEQDFYAEVKTIDGMLNNRKKRGIITPIASFR